MYKSHAEITRARVKLEALLSLHTERVSIPPSGTNIALKHSVQLSRYLIKWGRRVVSPRINLKSRLRNVVSFRHRLLDFRRKELSRPIHIDMAVKNTTVFM